MLLDGAGYVPDSATGYLVLCDSVLLLLRRAGGASPEEARALEGIGNSHLREGNAGQGGAYLRQALTISQRIGASGAQRIEETLHGPNLPESTE